MKINSLIKNYQKERRRVLNYINKLKKDGIVVQIKVPKIPKKITSGSIRVLQKLTYKEILKNSLIPTKEGKVKKATTDRLRVYRRQQKEELEQLEKEKQKAGTTVDNDSGTDVLLDTLINYIDAFPEPMRSRLLNVLNYKINKYGRRLVALGYDAMPESLYDICMTYPKMSDVIVQEFSDELQTYILYMIELEVKNEQV